VGSCFAEALKLRIGRPWEILMNSRSRELNSSNELIDGMRFSLARLPRSGWFSATAERNVESRTARVECKSKEGGES